VPPFPADYLAKKTVDPTICDSDPGLNVQPKVGDVMHASNDLSLIIYTAAAVNSSSTDDLPGVCISTDGGATFNNVPFPGLGDTPGPRALHCTDDDHCWAVGGWQFSDESNYVYYTTNASAGTGSTWTAGTLPATLTVGSTQMSDVDFFDNQVGYIVGHNDNEPLVMKTTDGGATWTDLSGPLLNLAETTKLHSVFALDANNVMVGGEKGTLLSNQNGGQP
jgi:hypothetical protein